MNVQPHPFLLDVARALLEKADRSRGEANTRLKLTASNAAVMFSASDADSMRLYELLLGELSQTGWVRLVLKKARDFQSFVEREPTLELLDFSALAQWAGYRSRHEAWDRRLVAHLRIDVVRSRFGDVGNSLADYLARSPMHALQPLGLDGAARALERLYQVCQADDKVSLRQLSSRVFQGRSKVLDNRSELLRVLGGQASQFPEAPIQLLASVPSSAAEVIFIENLLVFELMSANRKAPWTQALLLYAAGFRGGAKRLLERGGAVVYVRENAAPGGAQAVQLFLEAPHALPVYFFGDLDYSGMDILRNLRQVFAQAQDWKPGYERLLASLREGAGHRPEWADKDGQVDPLASGCEWADAVLLPAMRESECFLDQELIDWN